MDDNQPGKFVLKKRAYDPNNPFTAAMNAPRYLNAPDKPGWWWYEHTDNVIKVISAMIGGKNVLMATGYMGEVPIQYLTRGWWCGPLVKPEGPVTASQAAPVSTG